MPKEFAWWPDGTSCHVDELAKYADKSNNYELIDYAEYDRRKAIAEAEQARRKILAKYVDESND